MKGEKEKAPIDREAVRALIEQKLTNVQIAARLGCSPNSITRCKHDLGLMVEPRKPSSEWKARGRPRVAEPKFAKVSMATKYRTERMHLALQIAPWPAGIRFEDAAVPREPMFRGTPPSFGFSCIGNATAMAAEKRGFV